LRANVLLLRGIFPQLLDLDKAEKDEFCFRLLTSRWNHAAGVEAEDLCRIKGRISVLHPEVSSDLKLCEKMRSAREKLCGKRSRGPST
jgi:hypothetical protein